MQKHRKTKRLQNKASNKQLQAVNLLLSDCRGILIPQDFYNNFDLSKWHIDETEVQDLSDCYNESYWDCWYYVLDNAYYLDDNGNKFVLFHDGDLFAICYELDCDSDNLSSVEVDEK